ncbi:MAG TPA: HAMP domain-containing sensor histidine kinase [Lachnospiraceae bacterium]
MGIKVVWILLAIIVLIGCFALIYRYLYKRQVEKMIEELKFIEDHRTNLLLSRHLPGPSLEKLVDAFNEALKSYNEREHEHSNYRDRLLVALTNLSHDIRTPLTSIQGYAELLMDTTLYEEQEEYLKVISAKSRELRQILDKIFELVKLQDANYFLKKEVISINQILFEEVTAFYHIFEEKKFEVEVDIPPTRFIIYGDEVALHRIFKNLIQNIVVHGEDWASIHLVKISPHHREDRMEIRLSNQLENPNAIDMDKLFDRFYRVNSENKADTTGLGLPIVKELVERMNGRIKTDLTEDIFTITLSFDCIEMPKT